MTAVVFFYSLLRSPFKVNCSVLLSLAGVDVKFMMEKLLEPREPFNFNIFSYFLLPWQDVSECRKHAYSSKVICRVEYLIMYLSFKYLSL